MKELRDGIVGLALLVSFGPAGAAASSEGSAWITDGLTGAQRQEIWHGTSKQAMQESSPAGFQVAIGETVPNSMKPQPMPKEVSDRVPAVKSYDFAILQNQLLIVDPSSMKVIDIITQ